MTEPTNAGALLSGAATIFDISGEGVFPLKSRRLTRSDLQALQDDVKVVCSLLRDGVAVHRARAQQAAKMIVSDSCGVVSARNEVTATASIVHAWVKNINATPEKRRSIHRKYLKAGVPKGTKTMQSHGKSSGDVPRRVAAGGKRACQKFG